jgi:hypothetical protein
MHLDYEWTSSTDVVVHGAARDEIAGSDGTFAPADATGLRVSTDGGLISELELAPKRVDVAMFIGAPLRHGFRALVRRALPPDGSCAGLLLDDVSGAMVAAGYVLALDDRLDARPDSRADDRSDTADPPSAYVPDQPAARAPGGAMAQEDLCSGWRAGGTMMTMVRAGERMRFEPIPSVRALPDGAAGWPEPAIPAPGLRRHQRIEVVPDGAVWRVDAWFRDTYCAPDGALGSLHEYSVDATVDANDHTLRSVTATPHALPWTECPAAATAVTQLLGLPVDDFRTLVQRTLRGIESCTHLTNELRALADLPRIAGQGRPTSP